MKKRAIAYLHTHWDREWYREKEEFNLRLLEVFDEVIDELKSGSAPCFYFDGQTCALIDYLKFRPEKLPLIKKFIKEKKLFIGPFFVSADGFLENIRCTVKNLEDGINYSKKLGAGDFLGYLPDIFGHSRGVFEILKCFNIDTALIWRGTGAIEADCLVRGIKTTRLVEGYFNDLLHQDIDEVELAASLESYLDKIAKYSSDTLLLPIGADHLAILKNSAEKIASINKHLKNYEIEISCPQKYFEKVNFNNAPNYCGEFLNNSENYILGGVYSSRIYQKVKNAKLLNKISRIIEPLNQFLKLNYSSNIDDTWQMLLKNHAHDSIYGCSTDMVHRAVEGRFEKISIILKGIEKRIIRDFDNHSHEGENIGVFNMSNYKSSGIVKITSEKKLKNSQVINKYKGFCDKKLYNTRQIPVTEDITTIYEQLVEIEELEPLTFSTRLPKAPEKLTSVSEKAIENPYLKLEIKNDKINVTDKISGKIYNNFIKILDTKDLGDSYNYAPADYGKELKLLKSKALMDGKIQSTLRIYYRDIELDVILNNKSKFFEFNVKINNKQKNHKLQAVFNLNNPIYATYAKDSLGIIKREHDPNYCLFDNQCAKRPYELKTNSYPMQEFVYAQKTGILSEGLYEYEIYKNELRLALLRCTGIISNPKNPARSIPAGPPLKTPELQCLGVQNVRFGLCFCGSANDMYEMSENFSNLTLSYITNSILKTAKKLIKVPDGYRFEGVTSNKQAIFINNSDGQITLKKLANNKKVL